MFASKRPAPQAQNLDDDKSESSASSFGSSSSDATPAYGSSKVVQGKRITVEPASGKHADKKNSAFVQPPKRLDNASALNQLENLRLMHSLFNLQSDVNNQQQQPTLAEINRR